MKMAVTVFCMIGMALSVARAQITVAAAANMQYAMEDIGAAFKAKNGGKVTIICGASGKLVTQIRNGAPIDVFVSANKGYADSAYTWGLAADTPATYAYGVLVLWSCRFKNLDSGIAVLRDTMVRTVAVADLRTTAFGPAAVQTLQRSGLYDAVKSKLVYGDNVSQTAQYVLSGTADAGFVAKSIVLSKQAMGKGTWVEVPHNLYDPMAQSAVLLQYGQKTNPETARIFYLFLFGKEARDILVHYGYLLPH
jgi:molybdate transport system substrate-binding protein